MRAWLLPALLLSITPAYAASFTSVAITPPDGILNPDPAHPDGTLRIAFAADTTGTVRLEGTGIASIEQAYAPSGATAAIQLGGDAVGVWNQWLTWQLSLVTNGEVVAVTEVTVAVDATPPPPPQEAAAFAANGAVLLSWTGGVPLPPPFDRNVERYRILWAPGDLAELLAVTDVADGVGQLPGDLPEGVSSATIPFTNAFLVEGLTNGVTYGFVVEAIDHAGFHSGVPVDAEGRVLAVTETPVETVGLSELAGLRDRCFIVTAAYGDRDDPVVQLYRRFRDRFLLRLPGGNLLVRAYYATSPEAALWLVRHPLWRGLTRGLLAAAAPLVAVLSWTGPGPLAGLLVLLGWAGLRRRKRWMAAATLLICVAAPSARADTLSLATSPFLPSAAAVATDRGEVRYTDLYGPFGTWRIEFDYQRELLDAGGSWGPYLRAGLAIDEGRALAVDPATGTWRTTADATRFLFLPVAAGVRWRGRFVSGQWVVPYLGAAVVVMGLSEERRSAEEAVQSLVTGWHAEGGLELLLDPIDPGNALYMRHNYGIDGTSLIGGWRWSHLDDFGRRRSFDLSTATWFAGLRFQF